MIYIKDKGNNSQIYISRLGVPDYDGKEYATVKYVDDRINELSNEYATIEYVNNILLAINKQLENILG